MHGGLTGRRRAAAAERPAAAAAGSGRQRWVPLWRLREGRRRLVKGRQTHSCVRSAVAQSVLFLNRKFLQLRCFRGLSLR